MIEQKVEAYIERWGKGISYGGNERANLQMYITELCSLLDLPQPDPSGSKRSDNAYVFERSVTELFSDGGQTTRSLDLYRRHCFVLEGKDTGKQAGSDGWDAAIVKALKQAENYVRALPADEGRPPFIIVVDVGKSFALYSEFSCSGGNYVAFPDPRSHKISLEKLRDKETRELLRTVWLDPQKLDPTRYAGKVTRAVADQLARLAKSLEESGNSAELVASFLMRCVFTMFSEDVELLPQRGFTTMLENCKSNASTFHLQLESLWQTMNSGGFAPSLNAKVLKFNGGLFANAAAIELNSEQIELLIGAAKSDWRYVEPAIFGTLLERALNPRERHKLGAHYTPRSYVERLVLPTIINPLRAEWEEVQAAALNYKQQRKTKDAISEVQRFLHQLCNTRILDPACGSGNFLYVTLEHMKRLEGEVLEVLGSIKKSMSFDMEGLTVDPHQFLGLEINPRAAKIAEMVLWIGYLQWHFRTYGKVNPPEPVLRDFHNIEHRDALISYDAKQLLVNTVGKPVTRWDGVTFKKSPVTGEMIPDESAQVEQYQYINPVKSEWPEADYIVGNPPFIGEKRMRQALGDGYVDALRNTYPDIPACDLVMYWWHIAGLGIQADVTKRFGFITTNSLTQLKNRQILEPYLAADIGLTMAIPDHPWVDASDGAAVRIAMTVAEKGASEGTLLQVAEERDSGEDAKEIRFTQQTGLIHSNLRIGAALSKAFGLNSNRSLVYQGVKLVGDGFLINASTRARWIEENQKWERFLPQLVAGTDLTKRRDARYCIDFFKLSADAAKDAFAPGFQKIVTDVKPLRDLSTDRHFKENWWLFGRARGDMRDALQSLDRYIVTSEVSKHRFFSFYPTAGTIPDGSLAVVASSDSLILGVLSSRVHIVWALAAGGSLENRPRWQNGPCFENYPFPDATTEQQTEIRKLADELDAHRKAQLSMYPELTLTSVYSVLEKLRTGAALNAKEKIIHSQGLVTLLREIHDKIDRAVLKAYGWEDLTDGLVGLPGATTYIADKSETQADAEETLLLRLVDLNALRASEEFRGEIRWLRPSYQNSTPDSNSQNLQIDVEEESEAITTATGKIKKIAWPKGMRDQISTLRSTLGGDAMKLEQLSACFTAPKTTLPLIIDALAALEELGMVYKEADRYRLAS
ncbi:class I SAM-dependent DNA methyltransferase [Pseudomonas putida]|uniref:class I SAM-dependent DNA methyltransferase n=1 Tax=Pseudomonas putida TaxID=303 RepID=UPI000CD444FC|nr:DNA methyltransferase [Pseudomonas putida]POG00368.1 DNA methyltransferase [Pseudomonas putida]